jgi:hypothetical protein
MGRPRSWTDDDLRSAVAAASSWSEVRRRLGLRGGGGAGLAGLRLRAAKLELDTAHLPTARSGHRRWTDEQLTEAVAAADSLNEVFRLLGLAVGGTAWRSLQEHIIRLGLDTAHWRRGSVRPGRSSWHNRRAQIDDGLLCEVLPSARSLAEVLRALGMDPAAGSTRRRVRQRIQELGLSCNHLRGQAWARGATRAGRGQPLEEILVRNSSYRGGSSLLRVRLMSAGLLPEHCQQCGLEEWLDRPAPLQLDHINGDPTDNRLENLRLLCANCHAQTPTYCGRNIGVGFDTRDAAEA